MPSRRHRSTRRHRGAGYQTSQQFFNPDVLPPHVRAGYNFASTAPTQDAIRPVLSSTFKGGRRATRRARVRGGFSPSIMGPFVANAQTAIVPLAFYAAYHGFVPKKGAKKSAKKSRSSRR